MQNFKAEIEAQFARHLEEHIFWKQLAIEHPEGFRAVRETLLAPGKRLRPLLFCAACLDTEVDPRDGLMPVALALELAHAFILVHDDIIDRSAERRGARTLPMRMDELFARNTSAGFHGSDFALVTGDLLYTLAVESLLQAAAPDAQKTEAVRLFTRAALDTGRGALLEMRAAQTPPGALTVDDIENIYALKTGSYTFALPLQLAAVFCSSKHWKPGAEFFPMFGKHAGIAFQLLNDLSRPADDLRDNRRTWALVSAGSKDIRAAQQESALRALDLADGLPEVRALLKVALNAVG